MSLSFFLRNIFREIGSRKTSSLQVILAVAIGTGAVLAVHSYRDQLSKAILREAKNILGANLVATSPAPISSQQNAFLRKILPNGTKSSELIQFPSMLRNPDSEDTSLVLAKAMKGEYPYFGEIETEPPGLYRKLRPGEVLLDQSLVKNLKLRIGSLVQLGESRLKVIGVVTKEPGLVGNFLSMAPSCILHKDSLASTGLEQRGSRISYQVPILLPETINESEFKATHFKEFAKMDFILYESTEANSGSQKFLTNTLDFFTLLALCSLFLGGISILLSSQAGLRAKANAIAIYKCLGASPNMILSLVLGELLVLSTIGALLGFVLGIFVQSRIPNLAGKEFLFEPSLVPGFKTLLWGFFLAWVVPLASAWDSLSRTKNLSPLYALRSDFSEQLETIPRLRLRRVLSFVIVYVLFWALAFWETQDWIKSFLLCSILILLPLVIYLGVIVVRRALSFALLRFNFTPSARMALRKLNRPGTGLSWVIIGLGSSLFVLLLSVFISDSLLEYSGAKDTERRPNLFVMDIRPEQLEFFLQSAGKYRAEKVLTAPVIGARLAKINGQTVKKEDTESSALRRDWRSTARTREYFLSYRENPFPTEKVTDGDFWRKGEEDQISVEKEFSKYLKVELGDTLTFSVGGVEVNGIIRNFRSVNWSDMRPNFVVIFSKGILEKAPKVYLSSLRIESSETRYLLQRELVSEFPNLTIIDTEKAIQSFMRILEKVSFAIRWMTGLIVCSSLLLILASLELGRKERLEETSLLRILGATKEFLRKYFLGESFILSHTSFLLAILLAWISSNLTARILFEIEPTVPWMEILLTYLATSLAVLTVHFLTLRKEWDRSPALYLKEV
ncbi:ABC transporter permease [Leptospira perolatii]|uniref:ABC transporter permease n=1 Tax=Leptospira perolatii TaxID=2023191 RepID=A0A2M9ZSE3_9LEPT|nr:FtsX-like permease family protein [Leptospira perolatii]PJZ71309.1 ABC transporter permease [Leptospira perolatii]PJZ74843.1 ABC transporter permease [Leptospira perolatii]